jgi:hypothetical protein
MAPNHMGERKEKSLDSFLSTKLEQVHSNNMILKIFFP